jgi:hypothetical protein
VAGRFELRHHILERGPAQDGICILIDGDLSFSDVGVKLTFARSTQNHR